LKRTISALTASFLLSACTPYPSNEEITRIKAQGLNVIVQQSDTHPARWGASLDETKHFGANTQSLRMASIEAIEVVSGCSVVPESVFSDQYGRILSEVDCDQS